MAERSNREARIYDRLHYPGDDPRVPVNKLNLRTWSDLEKVEAELVAARIAEGLPVAAKKFDYNGLKAMHGHLFQDVYAWAGQERTYSTGRNQDVPGAPGFSVPERIEAEMNKLFKELARDDYLRGLDQTAFAAKAATYVNNVNACHCFIEGNGRAQRLWLTQLAEQAGYSLNLEQINKDQWYEASKIGFFASDKPMAELISANLTKLEINVVAQQTPIAISTTESEEKLTPLIPARELPDLTKSEIAAHLAGSERVVSKQSEIEQLSQIVYGRPGAMAKDVAQIEADPAAGRIAGAAAAQRVWSDVAEGTLLAGEAGTWLWKQSSARQEAMVHAPRLAEAVESYGGTVQFLCRKLIEQHQDEQKRHRQEVPAPSAELSAVLRAPAAEQAERLSGSDALSLELKQLTRAFSQRLAPDDYRAIRAGDDAALGRSLNISADVARIVADVHKQVSEANRAVQAHARVLNQSRGGPELRM